MALAYPAGPLPNFTMPQPQPQWPWPPRQDAALRAEVETLKQRIGELSLQLEEMRRPMAPSAEKIAGAMAPRKRKGIR